MRVRLFSDDLLKREYLPVLGPEGTPAQDAQQHGTLSLLSILGVTQLRYCASPRGYPKMRYSPAAAWYVSIILCAVFPRCARKNCTQLKRKVPLCRGLSTPTA